MRHQNRTMEHRLGRMAWSAHGLVTRPALLEAGFTGSQIAWRVRKGTLLPEFPGVYRVGHRAPSTESRYLAAVLACGEGSLLRGGASAYLYDLIRSATPALPEVATPTERRIEGIITVRVRRIDPRDATVWRGIPVTTVPRTLVDLAATLDVGELTRASHEAAVRHGVRPTHVEAVLARHPARRGALHLRRILRGDEPVTLSALERRFLKLVQDSGLPLPQTNRLVSGRYVDCRWPTQRLTVELDSYRFHSTRHAWELDRRREREAHARGDEFRRYTYGDVFESPGLMLAELRAVLW